MKAEYEPVVNGLRIGSIVEVHSLNESIKAASEVLLDVDDLNGTLGQVARYVDGKFFVHLMSGESCFLDPSNVKAATSLKKPGEDHDGTAEGFDLLLSPMTSPEAIGQEVSDCLFEKGFCVLKVLQKEEFVDPVLARLSQMGDAGELSRLPEEIEDGYLGNHCKGKVLWLDGEASMPGGLDLLFENDMNLTSIAQALIPYSCDALGSQIEERSPALVCLTLTVQEEQAYPSPMADDKTLGDFLSTWRRSLVRAVHFMGKATPTVVLKSKRSAAALALPTLLDHGFEIQGSPNTILLFRPDCFEYACHAPTETLMLVSNLLSPAPELVLAHVEGDEGVLKAGTAGPPGPPGVQHIDVMNIVTRLPATFDNQWCYAAGLYSACDTVIKIPINRWDVDFYYRDSEALEPWQMNNMHQSYIDACEGFDHKYFEISPAEAGAMDPVQRMVLETGAMSLAMYGITKKTSNREATHAGFSVGNDKLDWNDVPKGPDFSMHAGAANVLAIIANRFSFVFNMKGPNFVCDTACSASLVSTHLAKMLLRTREYDALDFHLSMGAHLCLSPGPFIGCSQSHMSTVKGRCFTFNSSADGYLRGEGCSGMLLKFGNNVEERDCLLRATQVGQDGRSASLTAPNGPAQEEIINKAYQEAKMSPTESTCWDCHGTGTSLGDPIEVGAVRKTQIKVQRTEPLMLTSVKSNIGHLEGGAGMAAMVKSSLQVKRGACAPSNHLRTLNAHLEHAKFDAQFETEAARYTYSAGINQVSSFGFGGTNGHAVFWGESRYGTQYDAIQMFQRKMLKVPSPEVRPQGQSPDDWESDLPDTRGMKKGAKWAVSFAASDSADASLKYVLADDGADDLADLDDHFFSITGNFNDWTTDRLVAGDVPGLWTAEVEIPESGKLEFHFLQDGDEATPLCPASPNCTRKTEKIVAHDENPGAVNSWVVYGLACQDVQIELFVYGGTRTLLWIKR